jgi:hypothetical protein
MVEDPAFAFGSRIVPLDRNNTNAATASIIHSQKKARHSAKIYNEKATTVAAPDAAVDRYCTAGRDGSAIGSDKIPDAASRQSLGGGPTHPCRV